MISDFLKQLKDGDKNIDLDKLEQKLEKRKQNRDSNNKSSSEAASDDLNDKDNNNKKKKKGGGENNVQNNMNFDISKLHKVESITNLIMEQVKELINLTSSLDEKVNSFDEKIKNIERSLKENSKKIKESNVQNKSYEGQINELEEKLEKFIGLYELVTNEYNPFVNSKKKGSHVANSNGNLKDSNSKSGLSKKEIKENQEQILNEIKSKKQNTEMTQKDKKNNNFDDNNTINEEETKIQKEASKKIKITDSISGKEEEVNVGSYDESKPKKYDIPKGARDEYVSRGKEHYGKMNRESHVSKSSNANINKNSHIKSVIDEMDELSHLNNDIKKIIADNFHDKDFIKKLANNIKPDLEEDIFNKIEDEIKKRTEGSSSNLNLSGNSIKNIDDLYYCAKYTNDNDFNKIFKENENKILMWLSSNKHKKLSILLEGFNDKRDFIELLDLWKSRNN
ncbi:MAG: flagella accessory protein C [Candidatus Woesearchaeota archaeon]